MITRLNKKRTFLKDMALAFSGHGFSGLLRLVLAMILARAFLPDEYGSLAFLLNGGYLVASLLEMGLGAAFIEGETKSKKEEITSRFLLVLQFRFWIWLLLILLSFGLIFFLPVTKSIYYGIVLFGTGQSICISFLFLNQTQSRFDRYNKTILLISTLQLIGGIIFVLIVHFFDLSPVQASWILGLIGWLPLIPLLSYSQFSVKQLLSSEFRRAIQYALNLFRFGKWVGLTTLVNQAYNRTGVLMLGMMANAVAAGSYDIAMTFGRAINMVIMAAAAVLSPRFARQDDTESIRRAAKQIIAVGFLCVVGGLLLYQLIGEKIILLLFGNSYGASARYLNILIPGLLLQIIIDPLSGLVVLGLKRPKFITILRSAKLLFFLVLGTFIVKASAPIYLAGLQTGLIIVELTALVFFLFIRFFLTDK